MLLADPAIEDSERSGSPQSVVYLLGAGATHGAASYAGSDISLVMPGLIDELITSMRLEYQDFTDHKGIGYLVNEVVNRETDFEPLLTFLEDTPSARYREFAARLKEVFSKVLRKSLDEVRRELEGRHASLYAALVDMHQIEDSGESLAGFLTLNYDSFLEYAIESMLGRTVDYGVRMHGHAPPPDAIPVLKLHGSFSWRHAWPIEVVAEDEAGLWIPPGIRKAKADYPFNAVWGAARELLDCDVLRIIGCNLGPNDWDLVSLLFTTRHGRDTARPYRVEVIGRPQGAQRLSKNFPYLEANSLLEVPEVGAQFIAELLGSGPKPWSALDPDERRLAVENGNSKITNPFEHWLRIKGELMHSELGGLETDRNLFKAFIEGSD